MNTRVVSWKDKLADLRPVLKTDQKIAIYGVPGPDNQFTRAVKQYGFEPIMVQEPFNSPPTDIAGAILCVRKISHLNFKQIKDFYREREIPLFVSPNGFTDIKEAFESRFVKKEVVDETHIDQSCVEKNYFQMKPGKLMYTREQLARRDEIVKECLEANMSARETSEFLMAEGFARKDGKLYDNTHIHAFRSKLRNLAQKARTGESLVDKVEPVSEPRESQQVKEETISNKCFSIETPSGKKIKISFEGGNLREIFRELLEGV